MTEEEEPYAAISRYMAWREMMGEKAIERVEDWQKRYDLSVNKGDEQLFGRRVILNTLRALMWLDQRELTVQAFPPPSDVGARPFDALCWPDLVHDDGPGINGEFMPCIMCGEAMTGADQIRMKYDGHETQKGLYCSRCSGEGP